MCRKLGLKLQKMRRYWDIYWIILLKHVTWVNTVFDCEHVLFGADSPDIVGYVMTVNVFICSTFDTLW